jgi:hypothetical protein
MNEDEAKRLAKEREVLLGLLREAENGRQAAPPYDGIPVDPVEISIRATRAKLALIETRLASLRGEA